MKRRCRCDEEDEIGQQTRGFLEPRRVEERPSRRHDFRRQLRQGLRQIQEESRAQESLRRSQVGYCHLLLIHWRFYRRAILAFS